MLIPDRYWVAGAVPALVVSAVGCQGLSADQRYEVASEAHVAALQQMTAAHDRGDVPTEVFREFVHAAEAADVLLDAWAEARLSGEDFDEREAALAAVEKLVQLKREATDG